MAFKWKGGLWWGGGEGWVGMGWIACVCVCVCGGGMVKDDGAFVLGKV